MRFAGRFAFPFGGGFSDPTFANLGYEVAGAAPGDASSWTWTAETLAEYVAIWGAGTPRLDQEAFEVEWSNDSYLFEFDVGDTSAADFDTSVSDGESKEDFEEGWSSNEGYHFVLPATEPASFDATPAEEVEDLEEEWNNDSYLFAFGGGDTSAASFDSGTPQDFEDFEDEWRGTGAGNDYDFVMGATSAAVFDTGGTPEAVEDFEETYQDLQVVADPATDTFTAGSAHGLTAGSRVTFRLQGPGQLPAGINGEFTYWVIAGGLTATAFKVSVAFAGAAVDLTDAGVGTFHVRGWPGAFWRLDP